MASENRLTEKHYNGKGYYMLCSGVLRCDGKCGDCDELDKLVDCLGEFEDKAENTVEVVRCVNCIHFGAEAAAFDAWTPMCMRHKISVFPSDYCSYGERRTE